MQGFIPGSRGSFMLDVLFLSMFVILGILIWSVRLVRRRRNFEAHRKIQLGLTGLLFVAIVGFELEIRLVGWRQLAEVSPYYGPLLFTILGVHIFFALSTIGTWIMAMRVAWLHLPRPAAPGLGSFNHKRFGHISLWAMGLTAATGWVFYYMAFIALRH